LSSEEQLIRRARTDPRAFGELYDRYYPKIFGYVFRATTDYAVACDITSETFLKAWIKLGSFKWKGISISSWFFRIATNEINQYFRRRSYTPHTVMEQSLLGLSSWGNGAFPIDRSVNPYLRLEKLEEYRWIHTLLDRLPPIYRTVIVLRYFEDLGIREIAEILDKKETTIRSLLFRGLERLKKLFPPAATNNTP